MPTVATAAATTATSRTSAPPVASVASTEPREQSVRVIEQADSIEPSTIPDDVRAFFAGRGFRLVPACVLPQEINRRSRHRSHPLRVDELTSETGPDGQRLRRSLHEAGFTEKDNLFRRSDTTIYMQPDEEYRARGEDARLRWLQTLPNDKLAASTLADIAGEELTQTGLLSIYTRDELTRRTQ